MGMSIHDQSAAPVGGLRQKDPEELLLRLQSGDEGAFEQLMRANNQRLFRLARSILGDDAEAEDAVQESYVRAYKALPAFRGEARLTTWLCRIATNEALGRLRKRQRHLAVVAEWTGAPSESADLEAVSEQIDPERLAISRELRQFLVQAIDGLSPEFRSVFVMRAVEGLDVGQTAAALGVPAATVKTRYHRARLALQRALDARLDGVLNTLYRFAGWRCDRIVEGVMRRVSEFQRPCRSDWR